MMSKISRKGREEAQRAQKLYKQSLCTLRPFYSLRETRRVS